jgi:hypothetical protein
MILSLNTCEAKYISTENYLVLQVCKLHSPQNHKMPDLLHAFECFWQTCHETFDNPQVYFDHVYSYSHDKEVEGRFHCQWHGEFLFHYLEISDNLYV